MKKKKSEIGQPHIFTTGQMCYSHYITGSNMAQVCNVCKRKFQEYERVLEEFSWRDGARGNETHGYRQWCRDCSKDAIEWEVFDAEQRAEAKRLQDERDTLRANFQKAVAAGNFDAYWDEEENFFIVKINQSTII